MLDRWVVAKLATLISGVRNKMDGYEIVEASREIQNFFTEDLSRWYVRRSRLRFQRPKNQKELHDAAAVLADVLLQLARLMASFTPFLSEVIWRAVTSRMANAKNPPSSVHLTDLPKSAKVAGASTLLVQGQASREIAALGLQARAKAGIKVRQPLAELRVLEQRDGVNVSNEWLEVVAEEINVKEVCFRPQLPRDSRWILVEGGKWRVALDSYLTPQLKSEGLIREIIRSIQEGRAELSLNPEDKILVWVWGADGIKKTVERGKNSVIRLTGAKTLSIGKTEKLHFHKEYEVDGQKVEIAIRKLSDRKRKASR
ncbi:MAG: class I tRNA ligase family protein [Parcubacteria group bacterium]|nr:class I tRNA ligase family protein [Parcubacteria group bacterium]